MQMSDKLSESEAHAITSGTWWGLKAEPKLNVMRWRLKQLALSVTS